MSSLLLLARAATKEADMWEAHLKAINDDEFWKAKLREYLTGSTPSIPPPPPPPLYSPEAMKHITHTINTVGTFEEERTERKHANKKKRIAALRAKYATEEVAVSGRKRTASSSTPLSNTRRKLDGEPEDDPIVEDVKSFKKIGLSAKYGKIFIKTGLGCSNSLEDELLDDRFNLPPVKKLVAKVKKNYSAHAFLETYLSSDAWKILKSLL